MCSDIPKNKVQISRAVNTYFQFFFEFATINTGHWEISGENFIIFSKKLEIFSQNDNFCSNRQIIKIIIFYSNRLVINQLIWVKNDNFETFYNNLKHIFFNCTVNIFPAVKYVTFCILYSKRRRCQKVCRQKCFFEFGDSKLKLVKIAGTRNFFLISIRSKIFFEKPGLKNIFAPFFENQDLKIYICANFFEFF